MGSSRASSVPPDNGAVHDVLIIDDSELVRRAVARILSTAGVSVVQLNCPTNAADVLVYHRIRLVIVDLDMPTLSGDRVAAALRGDRRLRQLKIILFSGSDLTLLQRQGREVRADAVVSKSDGPLALLRQVTRLLSMDPTTEEWGPRVTGARAGDADRDVCRVTCEVVDGG